MNHRAFKIASQVNFINEIKMHKGRNKNYATKEDIHLNTKKMAAIAQSLGINVTYQDIEWIYLIGKLVRERQAHNPDNFRDAHNYLRRAEYSEEVRNE